MEEQKKSRKPLLVGVIAAVVVLAALLALLLTQCVGGTGPDATSGTDATGNVAQSYDLYWNVDRNNFEIFEDESGQAAGTTARKPAEDGFYHVVFAKDGQQVELRVKERRVLNIIDAFDVMGLVFDENGDIVDVLRLDDLPLEKKAWQYYIQSFGGNAVKFNSSKDLNGMEEMVKINDNTKIYDMSGYSEFVGAPAKLQKFDRVMVIANELGEITHIFIYERDGIEKTEVRFCKHCNEEVTWKNWLKKDSLPVQGGHYFLDNDINTAKQNTIMDDQKVCLDLNGHTVYSKSGARIYSTFYAGSSLAVMDNTETPGKFIYEGQGADQGAILWARYGNIDIYDITLDASKGTSHAGGLCFASEASTVSVMHSGTMIGGETVIVKGKGNHRAGGTVKIYGNFTMESGLITGGIADGQGGNVFIGGKGVFTMNGGKITNGRIRNNNGGNVSVSGKDASFIMNGGTISGGRAIRGEKGTNGAGGNVYINGTFTMNGGTITGGRCYNFDGTQVVDEVRQNFFNVNGDLYMYGGTINGYVSCIDTNLTDDDPCIVYVSGTAKIRGGVQGKNLTLGNATFRAGKLRKGAEVWVNASGIFSQKTRESNAEFVHSDVKGAGVVYYNECLAIGRLQCVCGSLVSGVKEGEGIVHKGECDGTLQLWGAWDAVGRQAMPSAGGYYYLTRSGNVAGTSYIDAGDVYLDLNGQTITVTRTNRAFVFKTADSVYAPSDPERHKIVKREIEGSLTITDSVGGGTVKMPEATGAQAMLVWNWLDTVKNPKLTIYGGHLDASGHDGGNNYGAVALGKNAVINMYGGKITGNKAADKAASVLLAAGSTLNMYNDAIITGGTAANGHGGNVYIEKDATLNMFGDSKITAGNTKKQNSGNVYSNGTISLQDNASITGALPADKGRVDVFNVNGKIFVNGGHIGRLNITDTVNNASRLVVANNAKIDGVSLGTYGASVTRVPVVEIAGKLADDAKINVIAASGVFTDVTVPENADNFTSLGQVGDVVYIDNEKNEDYKKLFFGKKGCLCGLDKDGKHFGECDGTNQMWGAWDAVEKNAFPSKGGYYYLTSSGTVKNSLYIDADDIYLDLNGQTITVDGTFRAFVYRTKDTVYAPGKPEHNIVYREIEGSLTITDSVGGGTVKMPEASGDKAMLVWNWLDTVKNPQLTIYGGTLDASQHDGGKNVGAVAMGKNAVINMFGGTIIGNKSADRAGSVLLDAGSTLNMYNDAIITGGTAKTGHGGNVYIEKNATLNMFGNAKITAGTTKSQNSGNVYSNGTISLQDNASITGALPADKGRVDVFNVNGKIFVNGGHIGNLSITDTVNNASRLVVANNAKIDSLSMGTYGAAVTVKPHVEIAGTLDDDAKIVLNGVSGLFTNETVKENADNFGSIDGQSVFFDEVSKKLRVGGKFMCVCGAATTEEELGTATHKLGCDKTLYFWLPLSSASTPTSGNYYLTSSKDWGATLTFGSGWDNKGETIRLDLNGFDVVKENGDRRMLQVWNNTTLWLTNSKTTGGRVAGKGWANYAKVDGVNTPGAGTEHSAVLQIVGTGTVNMLDGVTLEQIARPNDLLAQGGVLNVGGGIVNMYGGKIIGAGVSKNGAAVMLDNKNAQFNMFGGEIVGGNATSGSAIYMSNGNLTIKNATVGGGKVKNGDGVGGAIFAVRGTITLENATITGADNSKRGGAVYLKGEVTATMTGGSITAMKNTSAWVTAGAALYVDEGADFTLNSGTISAEGVSTTFGTTVLVEARAEATSTTTFTMKGGKIVGGTANGYNGIGGSALLLINNNTTDKVIVDMQGGEITGGNSKNNAGAVYVRTGTVFRISGDAKITGNTGNNLFLADGVTIEVGTMSAEANVGVAMAATTGIFSKNAVAETTGFVSDNATYAVERHDGKLAIMTAGTGNGDGTVTPPPPPPPPASDSLFHCVCGNKVATSLTDANPTVKGECFGDCDGSIKEWRPWDAVEKNQLPGDAGYWYLTSSGNVGNTTYINDHHVNIDLNGQTINVTGGWRIFCFAPNGATADSAAANISGSLTITDTKGTGTLKKEGTVTDHSLFIWNWLSKAKNATLNIYGGHLDASKLTCTGKNGIIAFGAADVTINMFGGKIIGANGSDRGGAIVLGNGNKLNMSGNAEITGAVSAGQGGNVWAQAGSVITMTDNAKITNGNSGTAQGGNLNLDGAATLNISGNASITGGMGGDNVDVFCVNGTINASGNAHLGQVGLTSSAAGVAQIKVADSVKIDDLHMNIYQGSYTGTVVMPAVEINGVLNDDDAATTDINEAALIVMRDSFGGVITKATVEDNRDNFTSLAGYPVVFDTTDSMLKIDNSGPIMHCMCGASLTGTEHALGCDKVVYEWKPLNIDPTANRYNITIAESGNYYLPKNFNGTTCTIIVKAADTNAEITVRLDLNGKNYIGSNYRAFQFWNKANVWISNSKANGGLVQAAGWNNAGEHSAVVQTLGTPVINILDRVTLQQTVRTTNPLVNGGAIQLVNGATLNMYGGKIIGGNAAQGAAVYMNAGSKLIMDGTASIEGGSTTNRGGAIFMVAASDMEAQPSLVMNGKSTIIGGDSLGGTSNYHHGGAVYMGKYRYAQLNDNASITNGVAKNNGGNVNLDGAAKLELNDNASITGGKSGTNNATAAHADVFSVNGTLVFNGGHIGYYNATNTVNQGNKIYVKGNVKFDSFSSGNVGGAVSPLTVTGTLTVKEGIFVNMGKDYKIVDRGTMTDAEWLAMVVNTAAFKCPDTLQVTFENDGIYLRDKATVMHCLCGAKDGETHLGHCNGIDVPWSAWDVEEKGKLPDVAGNWYIVADATINTSTYIKNDEVIIDLNGKTVTVSDTYHAFIYQYTGTEATGNITGSVTITDSGENGTLKIAAGTKTNAGILFRNSGDKVANAKLNIYGGHLDASAFNSTTAVGAIDLGKNAVINMYGGKISGNNNAVSGAAVYLNVGATLNMSGDAQIIGGGATDANQGDQKKGGGAVMVNQAYLNMSGNASIVGGTCNIAEGGSVKLYGSVSELHMSGNASISGGKVGENKDKDQAIYSVNAKVFMNGGNISSIRALNTVDERGEFNLQGDAVIGNLKSEGMGTAKVSSINFVGAVTDQTNVFVNMPAGYCVVKRGTKTDAEWAAFEAIADNVLTCPDDVVVTFEADGIYLRAANDGTNPILYHCVCAVDTTPACDCTPVEGVHTAACATQQVVTHLGECKGYDVAWKGWDAVAKQAWPTDAGYWYLTTSGDVRKDMKIDANDIYLDLNGQTITVIGTYRAFVFTTSESKYNPGKPDHNIVVRDITGSLTITDSGENGTVQMPQATGAQAMLVWNWLNTVKNPQLTIYGGHLDGSKHTADSNGAIALGPNAVINMHGGKITGSTAATEGGAITLASGSVMNMTGGEIVGGKAKRAGAIMMAANSTLNVTGGEITGGEATDYAGVIFNDGGTLDVTNATISGGKAPLGATITSWGTVNITNSTINGGVATRNTTSHSGGNGGAFYFSGGTVTIDNTVINSGHVDVQDGSDTNNYGGAAIFAQAGDITVKNNSVINGYVDDQGNVAAVNIRRGGTIFLSVNAKMILENSTVTASKVAVNGGVLWMEGENGSFTMKGNSKLDASNLSSITYAGAVSLLKGTFNMEGGEIIGTKAGHTLAGGAVALTDAKAVFNMKAGTIKGGTATNANGEGANVAVAAGTFDMTGGLITGGNGKKGGGIYVRSGATLKISGAAQVTGNTNSNVMLADGAVIDLGTLTTGANIGVTMADANDPITKTASAANEANAQYIFVDGTTNNVKFVNDNTNALYQHLVVG